MKVLTSLELITILAAGLSFAGVVVLAVELVEPLSVVLPVVLFSDVVELVSSLVAVSSLVVELVSPPVLVAVSLVLVVLVVESSLALISDGV